MFPARQVGEGQIKGKKIDDRKLKELASMFKGQFVSVWEEQGTEQFLRLMAPTNFEAGENDSCG